MTTTGNPQHCKAITRAGQPCTAYAVANSNFCFAHDPGRSQARKAARQAGGRARHGRRLETSGNSEPVQIRSITDVVMLLEKTINDALSLENSLQRARTVGYLAGVFIKAFEVSELERRIEILEQASGGRSHDQS